MFPIYCVLPGSPVSIKLIGCCVPNNFYKAPCRRLQLQHSTLNIQEKSVVITLDGYGSQISSGTLFWWVYNVLWVFVESHALSQFRELEESLERSPLDSRVVWCTSLEASPKFYDSEDWQLVKTEHSYESVKYQIDLVSTTLDMVARESSSANKTRIRHFVAEPGVCSTAISRALVGPVMDALKVILFYIVSTVFSFTHGFAFLIYRRLDSSVPLITAFDHGMRPYHTSILL